VSRDLGHIEKLLTAGAQLSGLKAYDYRCLLVAHEIYRQQEQMWRERKRRIDYRIVSLSQPWVRPIVRGKASAKVEFGAKISVSLTNGYTSLHRLSWDAYNEGGDLVGQVEACRQRHGHYPESVHADKIYRTRANRKWCAQHGIRLSGSPLGRPRRATEENAPELAAAKAQIRQDELDRIPVEGKFGNAKRSGTLARVMAKLMHTSVSVINIGLIALNLNIRLREVLLALLNRLLRA
jgi:IS5 family transposase